MLTIIPFSGFYESVHDEALDDALNQIFADDRGDPNDGLINRAFDYIKWHEVQIKYAEAYAEAFADEFEIKGAKFESMQSPREYNFTTDRIFMEVPQEEMQRIFDETPPMTLSDVAKEMFTSRSGFISFYSSDWRSWGPLPTWDHNQCFALIQAHVRMEHDDFDCWAEFGLMERFRDNGYFEDWLFYGASSELVRLDRINTYLRHREDPTPEAAWVSAGFDTED